MDAPLVGVLLTVRCGPHHWAMERQGNAYRSVRLNVGALAPLYAIDAPKGDAARLIEWAEGIGAAVLFDPPGNMADGYVYTAPPQPAPAVPVPVESSF